MTRRRGSSKTKKTPTKQSKKTKHSSEEEEDEEMEEVVVPSPKKPTAQQKVTSSLQSFNSQSQHEQQEFDYEDLLNAEELDKTSGVTLTSRLKKIHEALKHHEQINDRNSSLPWDSSFTELLLHRKFIQNKSPEACLYLACIFADLIRISVASDERLYDDATDMKAMLMFLLKNLRPIGDSSDSFSFLRFYLLERLSVMKAFAYIVHDDMDSEPLIEETFDVFFTAVKDKESFTQQTIVYMENIMVTVIEGAPMIPSGVVKNLLQGLISKSNPIANTIAKSVLNRTSEHIAQSLADQLNPQLEKHLGKNSKERSGLFRSIVSLSAISSRLLLGTVPVLIKYLKSDKTEIRTSVTQLLGNMFSRAESTFVDDYQELFKHFLERCIDTEIHIRMYMARFLQDMLINHGAREQWILNLVNEKLAERVLDTEEKVRLAICEAIVSVMKMNIENVKLDTALALKDRVRDKKVSLRLHVMKLVCEVWRTHAGEGRKITWIPNAVIHSSITVPQHSLLEKLLDEHLLVQDEQKDDQQRVLSFVTLVEQLDTMSLHIVKKLVLEVKTKFRLIVKRFILLIEDKDLSDDEDKQRQLDTVILALAQNFPDREQKQSITWWQSVKSKKEVITILKKALDPLTSVKELANLRQKIAEKNYMGKSKEANDFFAAVFQKAATTLITTKQIEQLMDIYIENKSTDVLSALLLCAESFPYLFLHSFQQLAEMLKQEDDAAVTATLKILLSVGRSLEEQNQDLALEIEPRLLELAEKGTRKEAKYAARAISKIYGTPDVVYNKLYANLLGCLEYNDKTPTILSSLSEIALHDTDTFSTDASQIVDFIIDEVILKIRTDEDTSSKIELNLSTQCRMLGCGVLSNYLSSLARSNSASADGGEINKRVVDLLWDILEYEGNLVSLNSKKPKKSFIIKENSANDDVEMAESTKEEFEDGFGKYDAAMLRLAAAKSLIELSTSGHSFSFSPEKFLRLGYIVLDENPEVRYGAMKKLYTLLKSSKLGTRFLAILMLGIADPKAEFAATAKRYISEVIPAIRRDIMSTNAEVPPTLDSEGSYQIFPEYALPYLIFLLAHDPQFAKRSPEFVEFQKILFAYFDAATSGCDNTSFFTGLIAKLKTRKDITAPDSNNHLIICDLAVVILPHCAKKTSSVDYPGKMFIPGFFRAEVPEFQTPRPKAGFDTPRNLETPLGNQSAMKNLRTLYLPQKFKLLEKTARAVGTPAPTTAKKPKAKPSTTKKEKKQTTITKKRKKPATDTVSPRKKRKQEDETVTPRTALPRSAKSSKKKTVEESESNDEEMTDEDANPRRQLTYEEASASEEDEPVSTARRRRRRSGGSN